MRSFAIDEPGSSVRALYATLSSNDPDHPDGFASPDDMRFVQNFRAGRDSRDKFPLWSCCKEEGAVQQFSGFTFDSLRRG